MKMLDAIFTVHGECHEFLVECIIYSECCFAVDFGPWKAGEEVGTLTIDFEKGTMQELGDGGTVIRQCGLSLVVDV